MLVLLRNLIQLCLCLQLQTFYIQSPLGFISNLVKIEIKIVDCSVRIKSFENKIKVRMMLSSRGKNNFHLCISSVKFNWNPLKALLFMATALVTVVTVLNILECLPTSDISVKHMYNHTCLFIYRLVLFLNVHNYLDTCMSPLNMSETHSVTWIKCFWTLNLSFYLQIIIIF